MNSMPPQAEPTPRKKWRPRFSLRTFMIGVLLIALSWTATAIWGVPSTTQLNYFVVFNANVKGTALAPFIVQLTGHTNNDEHPINTEIWFWCFGLKYRIYTEIHPMGKSTE